MDSNQRSTPAPDSPADVARLVGERAENLFVTGQMWCAEAALCALNQGLKGGLPPSAAMGLAAGFSQGLGGSGCLCGALHGAAAGVGLLLAAGGDQSPIPRKEVRQACAGLHDRFKLQFGSTCCRVLCRKDRNDGGQHHRRCAAQTGFAAREAAGIILARRPALVKQADIAYLQKRDTRLQARLRLLAGMRRT